MDNNEYLRIQQESWNESAPHWADYRRVYEVVTSKLGHPKGFLDIGCGDGACVRAAAENPNTHVSTGVDINQQNYTSDGNKITFYRRDIREMTLWHLKNFDLVFCLEVAEHIPKENAGHLCKVLSHATNLGKYLIFSAATPGQGGSGHVNEQEETYWINWLRDFGFDRDDKLTGELRLAVTIACQSAFWYGKNITAYVKAREVK